MCTHTNINTFCKVIIILIKLSKLKYNGPEDVRAICWTRVYVYLHYIEAYILSFIFKSLHVLVLFFLMTPTIPSIDNIYTLRLPLTIGR